MKKIVLKLSNHDFMQTFGVGVEVISSMLDDEFSIPDNTDLKVISSIEDNFQQVLEVVSKRIENVYYPQQLETFQFVKKILGKTIIMDSLEITSIKWKQKNKNVDFYWLLNEGCKLVY